MTLPVIELYPGAEDSAFASMMLELLRQNMADHPAKLAHFAKMRGRVTLVAEDIDAAVTLRFDAGKLSVHRGVHGIPDLVIRGDSNVLVDLSRIPKSSRLKALPSVSSEPARAVGRALKEKRLRLFGALTHPRLALHLSEVLSIYA